MHLSLSPSAAFESRIASRQARIGIIGMGYVGLPLTLLFSEQGFRVTGFDVDASKVNQLNAGGSYIVRIPATEIAKARTSGFRATAAYGEIAEMDAIIICVPTPLDEYNQPDLSYIEKTAQAIAPNLREGQLVILESTTYPGTTEEVLIPILESGNPHGLRAIRRAGASRQRPGASGQPGARSQQRSDTDEPSARSQQRSDTDEPSARSQQRSDTDEPSARSQQRSDTDESVERGFYAAFSPEREDPGNDTVARRDIPKVIGGLESTATALASALYGTIFNRTVPVSTPAAAEMTKLLENIYRCVNIALVNELKQLCERMGIDIFEVIDAAKTKPFGYQAFYPGPGLGGHCIPIDPFYLSWKAKQFDFRTRFIELAGEVNMGMPYYVVERTALALNDRKKCLNGSQLLVLGLAYKRDVDDLRESPSLTIIELLRQAGAEVSYNDPFFPTVGHGRHYDLNMSCEPLDNLGQYDAVLIITDHTSYDYRRIVAESQLVIDARNATKGIVAANIVHC